MTNFDFNTKKFGQDSNINLNTSQMQAGGLKRENVAKKFLSIFDKVDSDKNGILDQSEMANFSQTVDSGNKTGQNGFVEKDEAKKFLYGADGQRLTYQDDKGNTQNLSAQDLNEFLAQYAQNIDANDIQSAQKVNVDGNSAVNITKNDGSQEIIFDDKNKGTRSITTDQETGDVTTQYKKDDVLQKQEVVSQNGDKQTTFYGADGSTPTTVTTYSKADNSSSIDHYENGVRTSKDVTKGTTDLHYRVDADGNEILETEVQDLGNMMVRLSEHSYEGSTETVTITDPRTGKSVQTKENGRLTKEVTTNLQGTTTTEYSEDGSRHITQEQGGKVTTTALNADGFKTSETVEKDGQTYTAQFDGQGHGSLVMKAGESWESFSQRTGIPMSDIQKNNNTNKMAQAGQQVIVSEQYVKPDSKANQVNANAEKAKGDAAETRLNNTLEQLSETEDVQITRGQYQNYNDYAKSVLEQEGIDARNQQLVDKTAKEIAQMNANKPIGELTTIKSPISPQRKQQKEEAQRAEQLANEQQDIAQMQQQNRIEGQRNARLLCDAVDGSGTDRTKLNQGINGINKDNAAETVLNYTKYAKQEGHNDDGICEAIIDEWGLSASEQKFCCNKIYNSLESRAKELGIDTSAYASAYKAAVGSMDKEKMDEIVRTMSTAILVQEGTPETIKTEINSLPKDQVQSKSIDVINNRIDDAENSLNAQRAYDGWAGDLANAIGGIYGDNTESEVRKDIADYRKQAGRLAEAKANGPDAFNAQFRKEYGIDYNPVAVEGYNNISAKWADVEGAHTLLETYEKNPAISKLLESDKPGTNLLEGAGGELKYARNSLAYYLNPSDSKKGMQALDEAIANRAQAKFGKDAQYLTTSEKYAICSDIAKDLDAGYTQNLNQKLNGESYESLKNQYKSSYQQAFGLNNKVAERVENYNQSQRTGAEVIKTCAEVGAVAVACAVPGGGAFTAAVVAGSSNFTIGMTDDYTSKTRHDNTFTAENIGKHATEALVDAAITYTGTKAGQFARAKYLESVNLSKQAGVPQGAIRTKVEEIMVDNVVDASTEQLLGEGTQTVLGTGQVNNLTAQAGNLLSEGLSPGFTKAARFFRK